MRRSILFAALIALVSGGCSVNPVTGENQLILVSEGQEVQMGIQAYDPTKQSQGGEYDIDPALTEYVQSVGNRLAAVSDRELPYEFAVLNNSTPNAWALPGGKIAINRGLLTELDSEAELAAVLGHEIIHAAARHSAQAMSRGLLSQVLVVATAIATSDSDYGNRAVGGANIGAAVLNATYGRGAELESDLYGMRYMSEAGYDPQGAVTLQEKFVRLSENRRTDWLSGLFASHPPSEARVEANRETAESLPPGGEIGREAYARAMRRTMQLKPAYDAYDEGRKALAEDKVEEAVALSEKALDLFNGEAHFHALRGDIRLKQENYDWAITNFTRAIERRSDFFYYHLQRGLAKKQLDDLDSARVDLERSVELMPTAPGYYALGQIAEQRGDIETAIQHYSVVAKGGGNYGQAASGDLARLDMPRNPGNYIARRCSADSSGNLVVAVQNQANVTVAGVRIAIQYTDNVGRLQRQVQSIRGRIPPGRVASLNTGLGPYAGGACPVEIVSAQVVR